MKKLSLISLAFAAALLMAPSALTSQTFDWSLNQNGFTGSGTIQVTPSGTAGVYDITGMTGNFANTNTSLGVQAFSGIIASPPNTLTGVLGEQAPSYSLSSPSTDQTTDYYDDLLYLGFTSPPATVGGAWTGNGGGQLDAAGLVFNVQTTSGDYEVQIFQYGNTLDVFVVNPDGSYDTANNYGVTPTNFAVPEGGVSFLYLLLGGIVCLGAISLKSRNGGGSLASA